MSDLPIDEVVFPSRKTKKTKRVAMRLPSVLLDLGPGDVHEPASTSWIQIAKPVGQMRGHPAGMFSLDQKCFSEIIANFRDVDGGRIPLDFEHASESPAHLGDIPAKGAPAQGWITDLQIRADGALWACVEWGTLARDYVRSNKYRYVSPAVRFGSKHPQTGKPIGARLSSLALTNQPFLGRGDDGSNGLTPITAKDSVEVIDTDVVDIDAKNAGNRFGDHTPDKAPKQPKAMSDDDDDATMTAATVECAECMKLKAQCAELTNALSTQTTKRKKWKAKFKQLETTREMSGTDNEKIALTAKSLWSKKLGGIAESMVVQMRAMDPQTFDASYPIVNCNTDIPAPYMGPSLTGNRSSDLPSTHEKAIQLRDQSDPLPTQEAIATRLMRDGATREEAYIQAHEQLARMTRERHNTVGGV